MQNNQKKKGSVLYGLQAILFIALNTVICFAPIALFGLIKIIPYHPSRVFCTKWVDKFAKLWSANNYRYFAKTSPTALMVHQNDDFDIKKWHLIITNHQSALDILLLQSLFNKQIPPLKFLSKSQLKWIPFFGFAWWALGYPFMKRYSKAHLEKNPHKKGRDIKELNRALRVFKSYPSSIVSFVEGTRITPKKKQLQQSPFHYLLKPKAGGVYHLMRSLGSRLDSIIDVTIYYKTNNVTLWSYLCRRIEAISIHVQKIQIPAVFQSAMSKTENPEIQQAFREWLNAQWALKDVIMKQLTEPQ